MNDDGSMARLTDLRTFGERHGLHICAVADLIKYRMRTERVVRREAEGSIEVPGVGTFRTRLYQGLGTGGLHQALWMGEIGPSPALVRVQAAPPPWAFLDVDTSTASASAMAALKAVAAEGCGAVVLMHLASPAEWLRRSFVKDFEGESEIVVQARAEALRDLGMGCQILLDLGMQDLRLLTSSTRPIVGLEAYGLRLIERISLKGGRK
jgi:3,4-dihydroxy 2-butanone 4-phosphate synthase/GTP cyclohydrolase II